MVEEVKKELRKYASASDALILQKFFKTGAGEYGEGDLFIGVKVPQVRKTAARFMTLSLKDLRFLIQSKIHEERLLALLILIKQFNKENEEKRKEIIEFYFAHRKSINNWDLVDLSAPYLPGPYLYNKDRSILFDFILNGNLWEKRIAVLTSFYFIKQGDFTDSFKMIQILLEDKRDLINKACGWMLREIGKRDLPAEEKFIKLHYSNMPRTMLRYAIEKFPEKKRLSYLKREVTQVKV